MTVCNLWTKDSRRLILIYKVLICYKNEFPKWRELIKDQILIAAEGFWIHYTRITNIDLT